ncbi:hypothetical protein N7499_003199 [Penicillium canescens]|uniref:uncharacterized protein n=1 Tax=Penicillium canescens TaxID=5083 RepID=UPI0026DED90C|nr:uncharacterized protein N7446_014156 [Penicillium canescens]KAJ6038914.1 hypothetical protein N7446_014156 [Penicillium canescens]KAJ6091048.1 hypothetical protein N7499_003199 [Penicillium canescens]
MVQDTASQNTQVVGVAERLGNLLLNLQGLNAKQWGSLDGNVLSYVFSLLYCCIAECYELESTPLAMSSLRDGLTACNLALQCVHVAVLINQDNKRSVSSQQQKVTEAIEAVGNKRFKNADGMSPAIYHSQAVLNLLDTREPGAAAASGDMHVRFGGGNRGIQVAEYHGNMGHLIFPL